MNGDTQAGASSVAHPRNWSQWAVVGVVLLTFALVVPGLGHKSLWIDEADSVYFAQHTWPSLLWGLCDPHPPGYYALLKVFVTLGGDSEFVVRLPSALAATLAVAALARLVRELTHRTGESATTNPTSPGRAGSRVGACGPVAPCGAAGHGTPSRLVCAGGADVCAGGPAGAGGRDPRRAIGPPVALG